MSKLNQMCILAGGKGTRLMPYTASKPKTLIKVAGKPFLDLIIDQAIKSGINNFLILAGYKGKILKTYLERFKKNKNANIEVIINNINLSTIERLVKNKKKLHDKFILNYSDSFVFFNLKKYLKNDFKSINFLLKKANKTNEPGNINIKNNKIFFYSKNKNQTNYDYLELGYIMMNKSIIKNSYKKMSELFNYHIKSNDVSFNFTHGKYLSITDISSVKQSSKVLLGINR